MGPETCLLSRIWLTSLCRTTSAQPYGKIIQHFLVVVMGGPRQYKRLPLASATPLTLSCVAAT